MFASTLKVEESYRPPAAVRAKFTESSRNAVLLVGGEGPGKASLARFLKAHSFEVFDAEGRASALSLLQAEAVDLIVLDSSRLYDGLGLCRELAAGFGAPIMMIGDCEDQTDRIIALEVGADEILSPACHQRELLARIRALLRRSSRFQPAVVAGRNGSDNWILHDAMRIVRSPAGGETLLTALEHRVLRTFMSAPGQVLDRDALSSAFCRDAVVEDTNFRTCISRLRRKLGKDHNGLDLLRNVRGKGYTLNVPIHIV
jgi:two-component system OmpR family response regulator